MDTHTILVQEARLCCGSAGFRSNVGCRIYALPLRRGFVESDRLSNVVRHINFLPLNHSKYPSSTPTYQMQPKNSPSLAKSSLEGLSLLLIPQYTSPVLQSPREPAADGVPFIPGGGLTRRLISSIPEGWSIPTASLLQFVMEGDNRVDARLFAAVIAKAVGHERSQWRQPSSWKAGLFGAPHDQTLYG